MSRGCFTPYDWSRSYLLPPTWPATSSARQRRHARRPQHGPRPPGRVCRHTGAHPTGLRYEETVLGSGVIIVVDVTATAHLPTGAPVTVHTRIRHRRHDDPCDGD
ncbi:MAG: hypothetical protein L0H64_18740 [Pseudonocardia sp.]|nr:hypothetical protein [Pseudonocardia sp.]